MESSNISKLDIIIRKLYLLEKKINKLYNEIFFSKVHKMKTIKEEIEKEEYIKDCGKIEP
tara:strand:- start:13861 stop:14040 length:180 start_codon:yes stop_codon:yes gene_type:complete